MRIPQPPRWIVTALLAACLIVLLYTIANSSGAAGYVTVCVCTFHNVYAECIRWDCRKVELPHADRQDVPMR